jgi:hypothetical protein
LHKCGEGKRCLPYYGNEKGTPQRCRVQSTRAAFVL